MQAKLDQIQSIVRQELSCSAHDLDHVLRVYNLCLTLAEDIALDLVVLRASALLHDIARVKEDHDNSGRTDHALLGAELAGTILHDLDFPAAQIRHIQDCIVSHRYKTGNEPQTIEAKILFDADKLDAIGAIGVARSYVWVGRNKARIYTDCDVDNYIKENLDGGEIKGRIKDKTLHSPQLEFATKVRFITDKLFTEKARRIGRERVEFFSMFLDRLEQEVKGIV
jgi:uncharacterized protein